MTVGTAGINLIKKHEKCRLTAYKPTPDDVPTVGWGHTGPGIIEGLTIAQETADVMLQTDLAKYDAAVSEKCPSTAPLQHDAMVSLCFNVGCAAFHTSSVARLHNAGRYSEACQAFALFNKQKGKVLLELVHRRAEEAALYAEGTTIPDSVKVEVADGAEGEKPLLFSKTIISTVATGAGAIGTTASTINQQVQSVGNTASDIHDAVATSFNLWAMVGAYGKWLALAFIVAGICGIVYARVKDRMSGRN